MCILRFVERAAIPLIHSTHSFRIWNSSLQQEYFKGARVQPSTHSTFVVLFLLLLLYEGIYLLFIHVKGSFFFYLFHPNHHHQRRNPSLTLPNVQSNVV